MLGEGRERGAGFAWRMHRERRPQPTVEGAVDSPNCSSVVCILLTEFMAQCLTGKIDLGKWNSAPKR